MAHTVTKIQGSSNELPGIKGHGIDIVELDRFKSLLEISGFVERVFVQSEIERAPNGVNRIAHLAGRFAVKEASLKAIGAGFGDEISLKNVEVSREPNDAPVVTLTGALADEAKKRAIKDIYVSISHSQSVAIASAIAC